eukprot:TRINITY_DN11529_c0_g1_i1.p1 TRINITY_DN11529_c0_g1~~TRINITY_DN11529_c0_g1_i1.p1  ORF type:complete len:125 (+),score=21.32 TRINITY_DN11529_c0_g1_i1:59-433(+)
MFSSRIPTSSIPSMGGKPIFTLKIFMTNLLMAMKSLPLRNDRKMMTRKAKILPPKKAFGPSIVQDARKIAMMVRSNVSVVATSPVGGQHGFVAGFSCRHFRALLSFPLGCAYGKEAAQSLLLEL